MIHDYLVAGATIVYSDNDVIWTWFVGGAGVRCFDINDDGTLTEREGFEMDNPPTHINEMLHYCRIKVKEMLESIE